METAITAVIKTGGCQCGRARYQIDGPITDCCYCHCSVCRKLTGASSAVYGTVEKADFTWETDVSAISTYQQNHHTARLFCSHCGSNLVSTHILTDDTVYVSLGSLDDTKGINIEYQQFTESKAGWVNIDSGVAAHDEWPELIKARAKELAASRNNKNQA